MAKNPINLAFRFILEIAALLIMGIWGWGQADGALRVLPALGVPLIAAALWGIFRVPNDPGPAPRPVPGLVRLGLEIAYFAFSVWVLYDLGRPLLAAIFGALVVVHYVISYDRIQWLVKQ